MEDFEKPFEDRVDAGRQLAVLLNRFRLPNDSVVVGLPRGGVVVGHQVAELLNLPFDIFLVRKLGVPGQEELAMGAIASGGDILLNEDMIRVMNLTQQQVDRVIEEETKELNRRDALYRGEEKPTDIHNRTVIVVDDGLATGSTMLAAVTALRKNEPKMLMVAVPVAAGSTYNEFKNIVDDIVCLVTPEPLHAVGLWYRDFPQISDEEVKELLRKSHRQTA